MQAEWFASWFDSPHYHRLYAHRSVAEAAGFIDAIVGRLRPRADSRVLDLGCGTGRHARRLASQGFDVTGIDLSAGSIAVAQQAAGPHLRFRRQDMRSPFGRHAFDYVFNFFTSFGYFQAPRDHDAVARNIAAALKDGGRLVLDYLNVRYADAHLTPREDLVIDGVDFRITRTIERGFFVKRIDVSDTVAGSAVQYVERVARFTLAEFDRLFGAHGLAIEEVYGTYDLGPYDLCTSPRLILVARKGARRLFPRQLAADSAHGFGRHAQV
jgi:SAM-dependent methyltransferase